MRHLIESLFEVQKNHICLVLSVDGVLRFMYSTDDLCFLSESILVRVYNDFIINVATDLAENNMFHYFARN